ncbi:MAG: GNAT family N-acetyltransferase [Clostridia bacterium]|nr:GNAT family N-acetyltransferase [Clostridia bacterium]
MNFDPAELFSAVKPGFFEEEHIRSLPPEKIYEEQQMDLHTFSAADIELTCPENITFGMYDGDIDAIRAAVGEVEEGWVSFYNPGNTIYCAFDGDRIVSFCQLDDFGTYKGLRIGGPGCVGTIPEYRKQGIGLKMVQNVTAILKERGYDIGYIHYTGVGHWYAKLGYKTIARWNCNGIID